MSTNISKKKREDLIYKINTIKTYIEKAPQDTNTSQLLNYIDEIEKELNAKKYGLIFEEHKENIDEILENNAPILIEDESLLLDNGGNMNFLIEGDNLASLKLLEKTHKGKIDVIYIDPPYNTGNKDFIYDDVYVDKTDEFRHSFWCSFILRRIKCAHTLLKKHGVIFISIDDNELYNLKLIMDDIFGYDNYLGTIIQNKGNAQNDAINLQKNHEYIICYAKNKKYENINNNRKEIPLINMIAEEEKEVFVDEKGKYFYKGSGLLTGSAPLLIDRINLGYTIYYNPITLDKIAINDYDEEKALVSNDESYVYTDNEYYTSKGYIKIRPPKKDGKLGRWTWSIDTFNKNKDKILITNNNSVVVKKMVKESDVVKHGKKMYYVKKYRTKNLKSIYQFSSSEGTKVYKNIINDKTFNNPKNLDMIMFLINSVDDNALTVLDFFAGSGTTGHAVTKLNAEDGGNRRFILCTNNENNICRDITYERIKRVIEKDNYKESLKYMKVDYVPINDKLYYEYADELLLHIKELVELENAINFKDNNQIAIVLTDEELESFINVVKENNTYKSIYLGNDVLPNAEQESILEANGIKVNIIPDYYYKDLEV